MNDSQKIQVLTEALQNFLGYTDTAVGRVKYPSLQECVYEANRAMRMVYPLVESEEKQDGKMSPVR